MSDLIDVRARDAVAAVADWTVAALFTCIVGEQMDRLKNGDRFYFMFEDAGFTPGTHSCSIQS